MLHEPLVLILKELDPQVLYLRLKELTHLLRGKDEDFLVDLVPREELITEGSYSILMVWPLFLAEVIGASGSID